MNKAFFKPIPLALAALVIGAGVFVWVNWFYGHKVLSTDRQVGQNNRDIQDNVEAKIGKIDEQQQESRYSFEHAAVYYTPKHKITMQYNKDVSGTDLESIVVEKDNVIKVLLPLTDRFQESFDCKNYKRNDGCVELFGKKYIYSTNKVTVFQNTIGNIEDSIAALVKKAGKDINNCKIVVDDYGYGKRGRLKLADNLRPTKEEVVAWVKEHGDHSGAYSNEMFAQDKKAKEFCSNFAQTDMPSISFFLYDENKTNNFVFFELNWAHENAYIEPESIRFID